MSAWVFWLEPRIPDASLAWAEARLESEGAWYVLKLYQRRTDGTKTEETIGPVGKESYPARVPLEKAASYCRENLPWMGWRVLADGDALPIDA